jgi:glycosyltransferase involved in cell wall biosynthesis
MIRILYQPHQFSNDMEDWAASKFGYNRTQLKSTPDDTAAAGAAASQQGPKRGQQRERRQLLMQQHAQHVTTQIDRWVEERQQQQRQRQLLGAPSSQSQHQQQRQSNSRSPDPRTFPTLYVIDTHLVRAQTATHSCAPFTPHPTPQVNPTPPQPSKPQPTSQPPQSDLEYPGLYAASDAFVLPSRGEGWGRPHVESMAMGRPVISTNWSGITAFLDDSVGYPLAIDGLVQADGWPAGLRWAQPSVGHLRALMRRVVERPGEARDRGARARARMVERYSPGVIADLVLEELRRIEDELEEEGRRKGIVREGEESSGG